MIPQLTYRTPQGTVPNQLLLEAYPINEGDKPKFHEVAYEEELENGDEDKYLSVRVFIFNTDTILYDIGKIEHRIS